MYKHTYNVVYMRSMNWLLIYYKDTNDNCYEVAKCFSGDCLWAK